MSQDLLEAKMREWREALRELSAAAAEAQKFARTEPLELSYVGPTDWKAMSAALERLRLAEKHEREIAEEVLKLRKQLDQGSESNCASLTL